MAWTVLVTMGLYLLFVNYSRQAILRTIIVGLGVLVITSPWWISLLILHGFAPLVVGFRSGFGPYFKYLIGALLGLNFGDELFLPLISLLGLLGFFVSIFKRQLLLPVWLLLILFLAPRSGYRNAILPLSMLAGVGMEMVISAGTNFIYRSTQIQASSAGRNESSLSKLLQNNFSKWFLGFFVIYLLITLIFLPLFRPETLQAISGEEREAMSWVAEHTPAESKFLVITSLVSYGADGVSEWFPFLSKRENLTLVQGSEWLPGGHSSTWCAGVV